MPSLALEENPVQVYPVGASVASISIEPGLWFVACTKSRQEKVLAFDLADKGIPYFLPLYRHRTKRRGVRSVSLLPLFAGYVFVHLQGDAYDLFRTHHVFDVKPIHQQERTIREMSLVEAGISHDALRPYFKPVIGDPYRVTSGIYMGVEGTLIRIGGETKFILSIETLGRPCEFEIAPEFLEPV